LIDLPAMASAKLQAIAGKLQAIAGKLQAKLA
jgi:hypothetical protein